MSRFVLTAQLQLQAPNNVAQVVRQIQSQLNNVTVNVQVQNAAQAQRQLQQVTAQTTAATTAADRMGRAFAISIRRFAAFSIATRAVGLFTSTLSDAIRTAIDFERQMIKVSQVTGDSMEKLKGLTKSITDLSTSLGVPSQGLLEVSTLLLQAGVSAKDTEVALRTLAKAALAPNFDSITETAEGAIAILAQFQEGVGALEKQLGSINAVAGAFAVEAGDLIDVIRRTGGVFKSSGGNLNELLALFTSVRATTRESAESIGTGLRTIFTRIQRPKTIEFLKQFGVELVDLKGKFVGPYEAVKRLSEALSGLGEGDITFIRIAEELGGFRQIGKVLPLLQQFSTAQQALNVANKAGNSLTNDAATAQLALAVRITKVKEEFLALVRGMTETKTFQIMANTALAFASALIKIGEAIKPLLPLLAAVAAVNLAKGLGSFAGGFMRGASSGRTYSTGGTVKKFARGGLVPGSGNRDTVPAMLMPGEFVIKKSSVNSIGAGNLENMNRYAAGGQVKNNRFAYGAAIPASIYKRAKASIPESRWRKMSQDERDQLAANFANEMSKPQKTTKKQAEKLAKQRQATLDKYPGGAFVTRPKSIGGFFLTPESGTDSQYTLSGDKIFELNGQKAAILAGSKIENYLPFRGDLKKNSLINNIVDSNAQNGIKNAVINASNQIGNFLQTPAIGLDKKRIEKAALKSSSDKQVYSTLGGYMYEGIIQGLTGAKLSGGQIDFDFNNITGKNKTALAALFGRGEGDLAGLIKADAKRAQNSKMNTSIFDKIVNSIIKGDLRGVKQLGQLKTQKRNLGGLIKHFASGGSAGTDTVPALLTPGEFVVNRSSAKRIGYGNLNRMNKVGKYAKGGVVQHFAAGGTTQAQSGGSLAAWNSAFTSNTRTVVQNSQAQQQSSRSMKDVVSNNKMFAATMVTSLIQGFLPAVDESSSALNRVAHNLLGFATTITSVGFALEAFGVTLNAKNIMDFFGSGPNSAGGLLSKGFKTVGPKLKSVVGSLRSGLNKGAASAIRPISSGIGSTANRLSQSSFARGFSGGRQGINPLFSAAKGKNPFVGTGGSMGVSALKNALGQLGIGGRLSARLGGAAGRATSSVSGAINRASSAFGQTSFARGFSGGRQGISPLFSAAKGRNPFVGMGGQMGVSALKTGVNQLGVGGRLSARLGGFFGQTASSAGSALKQASGGMSGIKRGLVSGFQGGRYGQSGADIASKLASRGIGQAGQAAARFSNVLGKGVAAFPKLLGPMLAVAGAAYTATEAFKAVIDGIYNFDGVLKSAIEAGDVNKAREAAGQKASFEGSNAVRAGGATAGAAVGMFLGGPIGAAIGAALGAGISTIVTAGISAIFGKAGDRFLAGIGTLFGGNTYDSAVALAAAQAGAVATQKDLDQAQKAATNAMEDFEKGSLSASEALAKIRSATDSVNTQEKRASDFATENLKNRGGTFRDIFTLGGLLGESSSQRNQRLGQQSAEQLRQASRFQAQAFQMESPARSAMIRSGFARGKNREDLRNQALGIGTSNDKLARLQQLSTLSRTLSSAGDTEGANAANEAFNQLKEEINQVDRELASLEKEVTRAKAAFDAMNLGLRGPTATAQAMSASMTKFAAGLEVGGNMFTANAEFLAEAVSGAAQAMNPEEIKSAMKGVRNSLSDMGVSPQYLAKFEANTQAFVQAQQNYNKAFENIKGRIQGADFQNMDADSLKKEFANELTAGLGDEAKRNLTAIIEGMQLSDTEVDQILGGNLQVFGDKLGEAGKKQFEDIIKIAQERQKAEQILIGFIQKRIDAERNFAEAQKEAVDMLMEGREIQGKYGGRAVSQDERRAAIVAKANANRAGIPNLKTGSVAELRARNAQIAGRAFGIETDRRVQGGMSGTRGVERDATQQDLIKAQKDQAQTIRDMIKLEEESLRIIQEKNKLEKDSMQSLISGDIEKFFEQQSAVGAQAALAAGDRDLANQFGAKAVGEAFMDITRQMEAGVQELFGRQLAGPGGLAEQAAGAALGARGITDPRMAQMMAGTSPEEQEVKQRLQELGGLLGETGAWMQALSEMQVQTAQINVANAQVELSQIEQRGRDVANGMYRGGMVYASRGMFVPRGTDTVPAMLTPGEFVVRRESVNRGNNLQLLKAINNGSGSTGYARGGKVGYYAQGGLASGGASISSLLQSAANVLGINTQLITDLSNTFVKFNTQFQESIKNLQNTRLHLTMDSVNVNVNINGGFMNQVSGEAKNEIMKQVVNEIKNKYRIGNNGNIVEKTGNLPTPGQGS